MRSKRLTILPLVCACALVAPRVSFADDDDDEGGRGPLPVIGLALGAGIMGDSPGDVYDFGMGKGLLVGAFMGKLSVEARFLESYVATPKHSDLEALESDGSIDVSSVSVRYAVTGPKPFVWLELGAARVSVPILAVDDDGDLEADRVTGLGPAGGVSVGYALGNVVIGVDVRGVSARYALPPRRYVEITGSSAAGVTYTESTDDVSSTLITVALSLRVLML